MKTVRIPGIFLLTTIALMVCSTHADAQRRRSVWDFMRDRPINTIRQNVDDATALMASIKRFVAVAKMSTAEFDKTVVVQKGVTGKHYSYEKHKDDTTIVLPKMKKDKFVNLKWKPVYYFNRQLFPSEIISMSRVRQKQEGRKDAICRPLGFRLKSPATNMPINWEIECVGKKYFEKVKGYAIYTEAGEELDIMPDISWDYEALAKQVSATPITVVFRVFDADKNVSEKSVSMTLRSVNDCIYRFLDMPLEILFAGYVQEDHPEVEKIKKEALKTRMIKSIAGTAAGEANVHKQVAAVWRALHDRGIQYSSGTISSTNNEIDSLIKCQSVRTFENSLKYSQANCVDGTIVFASILRKMEISPVLIITSDHCFLGYYTDQKKTKISYLETTMLGDDDIISANKNKAKINDAYWQQFQKARDAGELAYKKYSAVGDVIEVDIDKARKLISPIPFYTTTE